jgi:hypothetical protein
VCGWHDFFFLCPGAFGHCGQLLLQQLVLKLLRHQNRDEGGVEVRALVSVTTAATTLRTIITSTSTSTTTT